MIIEHNHQWCLHKYCTFFLFSDVQAWLSIDALIICLDWIFSLPIAVNAVWESTWVVFGKVSASRHPNKGIPSL